MGSLFPCLPDDLGRQCLVRVELNSHHNLRCVCKSWNAALKSPHFYQERKRLKISEQRICLLQNCNRVVIYDLEKNSCKSLPPIPIEVNFRCHFVKQKLVLITHMLPHPSPKRCVWLYDFVSLKWREGAKMPICLNGFASAVDEQRGMIYVAGGINVFLNPSRGFGRFLIPVRSALVYNVEEDKWDILPDMNTNTNYIEDFRGAFADGKFYVIGSFCSFQVFDSYTKTWKSMENRFNSGGDLVSAFGRLYCLSDRRLIEYDYTQDKVNIVRTFATEVWGRDTDFAVAIKNKIFVGSWNRDFLMLESQSERGDTFKLIDIDRPSGLQGCVMCAATLDL